MKRVLLDYRICEIPEESFNLLISLYKRAIRLPEETDIYIIAYNTYVEYLIMVYCDNLQEITEIFEIL